MHTKSMADSEGEFGSWVKSATACPKCKNPVSCRPWKSSCGGYEDWQYRCRRCGYIWWVDGPDS